MSIDDAQRLWIELGFPPVEPDVPHFTDADIEVLKTLVELRSSGLIDDELMISMTRVLGQALSRVAYAQAENLETTAVTSGADGNAGRVKIDESTLPGISLLLFDGRFERFLSYAWRRHLVEAVRRRLDGHQNEGIVGFADLVGYSKLTSQLPPSELPDLISHFERVAYQNISSAGGRVLKLIGDAVMFTAPDPVSAARAALGLRDAPSDDTQLPDVRVGLAMGPLVGIEGDLFGDTVNRANRLSDLARPGAVIVDDELGHALDGSDDFVVRPLRPRKLKGIGFVRAWVLRSVGKGAG